jgi:hypothetical protein
VNIKKTGVSKRCCTVYACGAEDSFVDTPSIIFCWRHRKFMIWNKTAGSLIVAPKEWTIIEADLLKSDGFLCFLDCHSHPLSWSDWFTFESLQRPDLRQLTTRWSLHVLSDQLTNVLRVKLARGTGASTFGESIAAVTLTGTVEWCWLDTRARKVIPEWRSCVSVRTACLRATSQISRGTLTRSV